MGVCRQQLEAMLVGAAPGQFVVWFGVPFGVRVTVMDDWGARQDYDVEARPTPDAGPRPPPSAPRMG